MLGKIIGFGMLLLTLLAGCAPGLKRPLASVSPAEQARFATRLQPALVQRLGGLCRDATLQAALDQAAARLSRQAPRILLVNDDTPELIALPDGSILVSIGLLLEVPDADTLALLLAHAIGHVRAGHPLQSILRVTAAGTEDDTSPVAGWGTTVSAALLEQKHSAAEEQAADAAALPLLVAAGIDPQRLVSLLESATGPAQTLARHPLSSSRRAAAANAAAGKSAVTAAAADGAAFAAARALLDGWRPAYAAYRKARQAEKAGSIDRALPLYLQAAEQAPDSSLLLTGLGMAYLRQEERVAARQHLTRAVHLDADIYYAQLGLGYIALLDDDAGRAVRHLQRSLKLLPTVRGGFLLAEAYVARGETDAAIALYRAVAAADAAGFSRTARSRLATLGATP